MNDQKSKYKDQKKCIDLFSKKNFTEYPQYLRNLTINLKLILNHHSFHIQNQVNDEGKVGNNSKATFSLIVTSDKIFSQRYQILTQAYLNQESFNFYIQHFVLLNYRPLTMKDKVSINMALNFVNKINNMINNIQLIVDPISGKIYFQTKAFIEQTTLSHFKKHVPRQDCFYTEIIAYSIKMAERYIDLVLYLIGQISLSEVLSNPQLKNEFQFLSESQEQLQRLQKSILFLRLGSKQSNLIKQSLIAQKEEVYQKFNQLHSNYTECVSNNLNLQNQNQKLKSAENYLKYCIFHSLQFFHQNIQSVLKMYSSKSLYRNFSFQEFLHIFTRIQFGISRTQIHNILNHNNQQLQFLSQNHKQSRFLSSKTSQYQKGILTVIEIVDSINEEENQKQQWTILAQGGFGVVQMSTVRFKNLSVSFNFDSCIINQQLLVRKRDKIGKKSKIKRQRKILQKFIGDFHPNIAKFYMSFQAQYEKYIYAEYNPHMSLDLYMKKNTLSVSFLQKLTFIFQAVEGLIFLHSKNIVHLDIKPGNMLVHKSLKVQLSDFGEAFVQGQDEMESHQHAFTVPYCAPQIFNQSPILCSGADIYAIGVCLLKQVMEQNMFEIFCRKKFTSRLRKGEINKVVIGQKMEKSFLSPIFMIIEILSLLAVSQKPQQRPKMKWIRQILEMCCDFIIDLVN